MLVSGKNFLYSATRFPRFFRSFANIGQVNPLLQRHSSYHVLNHAKQFSSAPFLQRYVSYRSSLVASSRLASMGNLTLKLHRGFADSTPIPSNLSGINIFSAQESELEAKQTFVRNTFVKKLQEYKSYVARHSGLRKDPKVFISHAWESYDIWTENLVKSLMAVGVCVYYDKHSIDRAIAKGIYANISDFMHTMQDVDRILIVGTELYASKANAKYTDDKHEPGLVAEARMIRDKFANWNEGRHRQLLPILLEGQFDKVFDVVGLSNSDLAIVFSKNDHFCKIFETLNAIYNITPTSVHAKFVNDLREEFLYIIRNIDIVVPAAKWEKLDQAQKNKQKQQEDRLRKEINTVVQEMEQFYSIGNQINERLHEVNKIENLSSKTKEKLDKFKKINPSKLSNAHFSRRRQLTAVNKKLKNIIDDLNDLKSQTTLTANNVSTIIKKLEQILNVVVDVKSKEPKPGLLLFILVSFLGKFWGINLESIIYQTAKDYPKYLTLIKLFVYIVSAATLLVFINHLIQSNEDERAKLRKISMLAETVDKNMPLEFFNKLKKILNSDSFVQVAIAGLSGSGKTELAKLYALYFMDQLSGWSQIKEGNYVRSVKAFWAQIKEIYSARFHWNVYRPVIWFLSGDSLVNDYTRLAKALNIPTENVMLTDVIHQVNMELSKRENWLIVFDDITNYEAIKDFLDFYSGVGKSKGKVIITTHNSDCGNNVGYNRVLDIDKGLEVNEATQLLQRLSGVHDPDGAISLVQELDCSPAAIASAAAFIKEENLGQVSGISFKEYGNDISIRKKMLAMTSSSKYQNKSLVAALGKIYEKIQQSNDPKDKALNNLLNFCSLINAKNIPSYLLQTYWEAQQIFQNLSIYDVLNRAKDFSLIHLESNNKKTRSKYYYIHHSVHDKWSETATNLIPAVTHALEKNWPAGLIEDEPFLRSYELMPHTEVLLDSIKGFPINDELWIQLLYVKNCYANYKQSKINDYEIASKLLKEEKDKVESFLAVKNANTHDSVATSETLGAKHPKLPRRYVQCLYFFFRNVAIYRNQLHDKDAENALVRAIAIGTEIDSNKKSKQLLYDDMDNNSGLDTYIYRRQGEGLLHLKRGDFYSNPDHKDEEKALAEYNTAESVFKDLLDKVDYGADIQFPIFTHELLSKVYLAKAPYSAQPQETLSLAEGQFAKVAAVLTKRRNATAMDLLHAPFGNFIRVTWLLDTLGNVYLGYNDSAHNLLARQCFLEAQKKIPNHYKKTHLGIHLKLIDLFCPENGDALDFIQARQQLRGLKELIVELPAIQKQGMQLKVTALEARINARENYASQKNELNKNERLIHQMVLSFN